MSNEGQEYGIDYLNLADYGVTNEEEQAWDPESSLPPGDYQFEIIDCQKKAAGTGTPQFVVKNKVVDGEFAGRQITGFYPLTEKAIGKLLRLLKAVGMTLDEKKGFSPKALVGKRYMGTVVEEAYKKKNPITMQEEEKTSVRLKAERPIEQKAA